jgi:hypothetical protein
MKKSAASVLKQYADYTRAPDGIDRRRHGCVWLERCKQFGPCYWRKCMFYKASPELGGPSSRREALFRANRREAIRKEA